MIGLILWAVGGVAFSVAVDVYSSGVKFSELNLAKWWNDNGVKLIFGVVCLIPTVYFFEQMSGLDLTAYSAFLTGFGWDAVLNNWTARRRKVNK